MPLRRTPAALVALVVACSSPGGEPKKGAASAGTPGSAIPTAARSAPPGAPVPSAQPEKLTAAIRDNSSPGETKEGASLATRLFVSRIHTTDELHVALQLRPEQPLGKDHPWNGETVDLAEVPSQLRVELTTPSGKRSLQASGTIGSASPTVLAALTVDLFIGPDGIRRWDSRIPWKDKPKGLFEAPGEYELVIAGELKTNKRSLPVRSGPLKLRVVGSDVQLPMAQLEALAADLVKSRRSLSEPPRSSAAPIDDVDGNVWFRFQLAADPGGGTGYDVDVIEVLLDPKGEPRNYDAFRHFTCVAEGTPVLTPSGDRPVEALRPGDVVVAFDVARGARSTATVEHVESAHVERLVEIGRLRVTASHPVWADGRFVRADQIERGARLFTQELSPMLIPDPPREVVEGTTVYEVTVSPPHTYFAAGLLVHNKAVHQPVGGQRQPYNGWFFRRAARR